MSTGAPRVFVTGATGVIGRPTMPRLVAAGYEVVGVARRESSARALEAAGARPVDVDLFGADAVREATRGCDAVVHLATNVPAMLRMGRSSAWETHNRLRTEATAHLLAAAHEHGIERFVKESITFVYPDERDRWIDEDTAPDDTVVAWRPTLEGERLVTAFGAEGGQAVVLRFGSLYSADGRSTEEYLSLARRRIAPVAGRADGYVSSIHADDAATAVVAGLELPAGTYNVVDDEPVRRRDYADAFASSFGLPRLHVPPAWILRALGGASARGLTASQRVSNARLRATGTWTPRFADVRVGWASAAARAQEHSGG